MTVVHSADQVIGSIPTEQADLSVADILDRAADLIGPEGRWQQGSWFDTSSMAAREGDYRCVCAEGALILATGCVARKVNETAAHAALCDVIESVCPAQWNDAAGRTQAEVVAALRAAAEKARTASAVGTSNASEPNTPAVSS